MSSGDVWQRSLERLRLQMTQATFNQWLKDTRLIAIKGDVYTVGVKSEAAIDWLETRLKNTIVRTLAGVVEGPVEVKYTIQRHQVESPTANLERVANDNPAMSLLALLADDKNRIPYRPRLNQITGSVTASILLQQVIFRWFNQGRSPFYKFFAPCNHAWYKEGDSWQEELGFTRWELNGALKKIGYKVMKGDSKVNALKTAFVLYWTDKDRVTWFELNEQLAGEKIGRLYQQMANVEKPNEEKPH